jgi:hypothetical protein
MTDQVRRRRRRRRGRRGSGAGAAGPAEQSPEAPAASGALPSWLNYSTFTAFALGVVLMGLFTGSEFGIIVFYAGIFGLALAGAHFATRRIIANRRRR